MPCPVRHVGQDAGGLRSGQHLAGHRLLDVPFLDIHDRPYGDPGAIGEPPGRSLRDRGVGKAVARQRHPSTPAPRVFRDASHSIAVLRLLFASLDRSRGANRAAEAGSKPRLHSQARRWEVSAMGFEVLIAFVVIILFIIIPSLRICSEWERKVVLRLGRFGGVRGPGVFLLLPWIERTPFTIDLRTVTSSFTAEQTLTKDNVPVNVDTIIFWRVVDPARAVLQVENYIAAVMGA